MRSVIYKLCGSRTPRGKLLVQRDRDIATASRREGRYRPYYNYTLHWDAYGTDSALDVSQLDADPPRPRLSILHRIAIETTHIASSRAVPGNAHICPGGLILTGIHPQQGVLYM